MIYAIGIKGFLTMRFAMGTAIAEGRRVDPREGQKLGAPVWQTYEEASIAAAWNNEKRMKAEGRTKLCDSQQWIVVGVDGDWLRDTTEGEFEHFPNARQLRFARPMVEIEQRLNL